jgi:hypothetical protein
MGEICYQSLRNKLAPVGTITVFLSLHLLPYSSALNAKGKAVAMLNPLTPNDL